MNHRIHILFAVAIALGTPIAAHATALANPLGSNSIEELFVSVSRAMVGIVALASTFMFIYGGIMMLTSGGNADQVRRAKETLKWTAIALLVIFLSSAILRFVFTALGASSYYEDPGIFGNVTLQNAVVNIMRVLLGLLGIVAAVMVVLGGYWWLTAAGNEQRVEKAKNILRTAIIGLIIVLLSWAIINFTLQTVSNTTGAT